MPEDSLVPEDVIIKKIILVREEKVMLDIHLAELYQVETRVLKQAVRRNIERFPKDFMFELTDKEIAIVVSHSVIPSKKHLGGATPFVFTEAGVAMLSSVLNSDRAVKMNIAIIRTFIMLRKMASNYQELTKKLEEMEKGYKGKFKEIYEALNYLLNPPVKPGNRIGFDYKKKN
jgi:ORF6N domain-containing protein